jgi:hypothetical protein
MERRYPGVESLNVAAGLYRQRSRREQARRYRFRFRTGEQPAAPVFIDGKKVVSPTTVAADFKQR